MMLNQTRDDTVLENDKKLFEVQANQGVLVGRFLTTPEHENQGGSIFGGWLVAQIDRQVSMVAIARCQGRVVTKAIDQLEFIRPILSYQLVDIYARLIKQGQTSVCYQAALFAGDRHHPSELAIRANLTFVRINEARKPIAIKPNNRS
ncbi:MAG: acyl-CoA thioesterase [Pseudomonadota bacterium]